MSQKISDKLTLLTLLMASLLLTSCNAVKEMQAMKKPRYEIGEHKGARFCGECHKEIYEQWLKNSRHALANNSGSFHEMKGKVKGKFMLNTMMGTDMCYSCHGNKSANEGVNCETCHGVVVQNASIEQTHEKKYKPNRENLKKKDFCARCHEMKNPMSGSAIMSVYGEWQRSEAASKGITCQDCHMKPRGNNFRYHGFDTAIRNVEIYKDDLSIEDIKLNFPELGLTIKNRVSGHDVPASCGTRLLVMEIGFLKHEGREIYKIVQTFVKKNELMSGLMPYKVIENTQLQNGENRNLKFILPSPLQGQISQMSITLRFYEVPDEYQGNLKKASWISEPFLKRIVNL